MAAGLLFVPGKMPSFNRDGDLVVGALWFYENLTDTPKTVYANSSLTTPLSQPVVSDQSGNFPAIWADAGSDVTPNLFSVVWATDAPDAQSDTLDGVRPSQAYTVVSPTLSIGTVGTGTPPDASITGTAPNYVLNLTLQPGPQGPAGPTGPGTGDTLSPATNNADYVPQWNGANSKVLKNGRAIGAASSTDLLDRAAGDARYLTTGSIRERLAANRTYYVRTDGNDANTGLVNNAGGAFLTIQRAVDVAITTLDFASYTVTVQIADGTYSSSDTNIVGLAPGLRQPSQFVIQGNSGTPGNVIVQRSTGSCFNVANDARVTIKDLRTEGNGNHLYADAGSYVEFGNIVFAASTAMQHIHAGYGTSVKAISNYSIVGGGNRHLLARYGGFIDVGGRTVTLTGTMTFAVYFVQATSLANVEATGATFSGGTVTATRYYAVANAFINTGGGGANFFPGNAAGSVANGGVYL